MSYVQEEQLVLHYHEGHQNKPETRLDVHWIRVGHDNDYLLYIFLCFMEELTIQV